MRIETLAAVATLLREVLAANDNAPPAEPPVVRSLRRRPDATYACSENVILPLVFAERMAGWKTAGAGGPRHCEGAPR